MISGAPGEIRTPDLLLRRQSLYPAELRARSDTIIPNALPHSAALGNRQVLVHDAQVAVGVVGENLRRASMLDVLVHGLAERPGHLAGVQGKGVTGDTDIAQQHDFYGAKSDPDIGLGVEVLALAACGRESTRLRASRG